MTAILLIILNLFVLESLLSVDNAAVLAVMVKDLPGNQKKKALRYGILGAYLFRGILLFAASWLVKIFWLKAIGGAYLMYLTYKHFTYKQEDGVPTGTKVLSFFSRIGVSRLWATVALVELMDLVFSIDNIFAAVAICDKFVIVMVGVAIGILAMRFVASWFVSLIQRFPTLETSAFIVIWMLGLKLIFSALADYSVLLTGVRALMKTSLFDLVFSSFLMIIFFIPLLIKRYGKGNSVRYN